MPIEAYAFSHREKIIKESSSGGAFSAITEAFFSRNPKLKKVVYGVTFNENMEAVYLPAYTLEECWKFRGSKYVRSNMNGIPEDVARQLQQGFEVLFVGTPCFVCALKNKLRQWNIETDRLWSVDLICHGTPEIKYWNAYKEWLENKNKSKMIRYQFRTHLPGKGPYTAIVEFEDGKKLIGSLETAIFNRMFLRHYILSEGCFKCRFANLDREGDLTIGDFWGIEEVMPNFPKGVAVSEILVNTEKGRSIVQWMKRYDGWNMQQCMSMDFVRYQNNLQRPAEKPKNYEQFMRAFQKNGLEYVAKKYVGYDFFHRVKAKMFRK